MPRQLFQPIISFIHRIAATAELGKAGDAQLLRRFIAEQDQLAFTALVHRHGPMVLGICQRVLRHGHDAEDAFQATFLVLARKAKAIGRPEQLGNWLYGVAYRTALEAKTRRARRSFVESKATSSTAADPAMEAAWVEVRQVLDDEISRLPSRYRWPFVLCHLQGKTNQEAADLIGCPQGTVCSRLAWARERLRNRLTRRGVGISAAVLGTLLAEKASVAGAAPALFALATNPATGGEVAALTDAVVKGLVLAKLKAAAVMTAAAAVLVGAIGFGIGSFHPGTPGEQAAKQSGQQRLVNNPGPEIVDAKPAIAKEEAKPKTDLDALQGAWKVIKVVLPSPKGGTTVQFDDSKGLIYTFQGEKLTITPTSKDEKFDTGNLFRVTFGFSHAELGVMLDEHASPRAIDRFVSIKGTERVVMKGVYDLQGDTLMIWDSAPWAERPTATEVDSGLNCTLWVLERMTP